MKVPLSLQTMAKTKTTPRITAKTQVAVEERSDWEWHF